MTLTERVTILVQSQFDAQHLTQELRVEAISHLVGLEILAISTQFANYLKKKNIEGLPSDFIGDFIENHYGNGTNVG